MLHTYIPTYIHTYIHICQSRPGGEQILFRQAELDLHSVVFRQGCRSQVMTSAAVW